MRIGFVINPEAGDGSAVRGDRVARFAKLGPVVLSRERADLDAQLIGMRDRGIDVLAVVGGDGTIHRALQAASRVWTELPTLLPLATGTMGIVHRDLGVPELEQSLDALEWAVRHDRHIPIRRVPTLSVDGRIAFNVGIGLWVSLAERVSADSGGVWGFATRLIASAAIDGSLAREVVRSIRCGISVDGDVPEIRDVCGIYASALQRLWWFRGWSTVDRPLNGFRVLTVDDRSPSELLGELPAFAAGLDATGADLRGCRELVITARELRYVADGEGYVASGGLSIRPGPSIAAAIPHMIAIPAAA